MDVDTEVKSSQILKDYQLSVALSGHDEACRDIAHIGSDIIAVACAAGQMAIWEREDDRQFFRKAVFPERVHAGLAFCVEAVKVAGYPENTFISGGNDKVAKVWTSNGSIIGELKGHTDCVNCISFTPGGDILTGSWDGTVKFWQKNVCVRTLGGHAKATEVLALPTGEVVTASTNKTINIFSGETLVKSIANAHNHAIKKLIVHPFGFASCGNDGFVKVWSNRGDQLLSIQAHTATGQFDAFCYGIAILPYGELVSVGEDGTARIWAADGTQIQKIQHPGPIRAVKTLANGDFVTACNDRSCRIFTKNVDRVAPADELQKFDNFVQQMIASNMQRLDIGELPDEKVLLNPGKRDGDIKVVRSNNKAMVYKWSAGGMKWDVIGEALGKANKEVLEGKEFDVVSTIYVEDKPLKLGFNKDDDPMDVAKRFCARYHLPDYLLEQIVTHVAGQVDSSALAAKKKAQEEQSMKHIPAWASGAFQLFGTAKADLMKKAILKSNEEFVAGNSAAAMNDGELATFDRLMHNIADANNYHVAAFSDAEAQLFEKLLSWPSDKVLPVLDAYRVLMLHQDAVKKIGNHPRILTALIQHARSPAATHNHCSLILKGLANFVAKRIKSRGERADPPQVPEDVTSFLLTALREFGFAAGHDNPAVVNAYVMFVYNVVYWYCRLGFSESEFYTAISNPIFTSLPKIESSGKGETLFYALLSVGTIAYSSKRARAHMIDSHKSQIEAHIKSASASTVQPVAEISGDLRKVFFPVQ